MKDYIALSLAFKWTWQLNSAVHVGLFSHERQKLKMGCRNGRVRKISSRKGKDKKVFGFREFKKCLNVMKCWDRTTQTYPNSYDMFILWLSNNTSFLPVRPGMSFCTEQCQGKIQESLWCCLSFSSISSSSSNGVKSIKKVLHAKVIHCQNMSSYQCNIFILVIYIFFYYVSSSVQLQSWRNLWLCEWMPPSHRKLPVPRSRDRTGLQLLWNGLLQPPTRRRMWEV